MTLSRANTLDHIALVFDENWEETIKTKALIVCRAFRAHNFVKKYQRKNLPIAHKTVLIAHAREIVSIKPRKKGLLAFKTVMDYICIAHSSMTHQFCVTKPLNACLCTVGHFSRSCTSRPPSWILAKISFKRSYFMKQQRDSVKTTCFANKEYDLIDEFAT